jgi:ATP-binding cassette subfamily F protein 3
VKYGSGISMGYFSPDAASQTSEKDTDTFDRAISVLEFMEEGAPTALIPKIRDMLGAFLFRGDDVYKSIQVLSGGEKSRLALLKMLLKPINLLILDEPTNHLDLYSKDILLNVLRNFQGTIIFVSHDRAFMEELSTKTLLLTAANDSEKASAKLFYGNYAYYLEQTAKSAGPNFNEKKSNKNEPIKQTNEQINNKEQREKDKEKQAVIRKLERQEAEILKTIEELEARKESLEEELALPAVYSNREKAKEVKENLDVCISAIQSKSREWELLAGELVSLK